MHVREATDRDLPFLAEMLYVTATWRCTEGGAPPEDEVLADPAVARYLEGWGREGDLGVVAVADRRRVGAAWMRCFPEDEPGYGFVAADVPELSIAVAPGHRGRGTGSALLDALVELASERGWEAVSLSVEADNPARHLYRSRGFERVWSDGTGAWTMLRRT